MKNIKSIITTILLLPITITKHLIAVLDFKEDLEDFMFDAAEIANSMAASSYFTASATLIADTTTDVLAMAAVHAATKTNPPTKTIADRDVAKLKVVTDLRKLRRIVQGLADADPANAEDIINAAKMKVKKQGAINKQDFTVKDGKLSGTVNLVAKGIESARAAHDWAWSIDGTNWTPITPTLAATTLLTGLTPGSILDFRHRAILKDGPTNWIESTDFVVK